MRTLSILLLTLTFFALSGCAHSAAEKRVDDRMTKEYPKDSGDVRAEVGVMIDTAPGLNDDQRKQLRELHTTTMAEMGRLRDQNLKLRALLVEEIITENYDADAVDVIKKRLRKVENQRLSLLFSTIEKANLILGHAIGQNGKLVHAMFHQHSARSL